MKLLTSLNGIFPRSQNLIEKTRRFERKKITILQLEKTFDKDYDNLKKITKDIDLVSDGLLCWQDLLRPFSVLIKGTEVNGLVRYFETNCFYRRILLPRKIKFNFKKIYPKYFRFGNTAFLPSLGMFKFFSNADYSTIVTILTETIKYLCFKKTGVADGRPYKYIILQEPYILFNFNFELKKHFTILVNKIRKECLPINLIVNTFFRAIEKQTLQFLLDQNIDGIGIDFTYNSLEEIVKVKWPQDKGIFANILNNASTKIEDKESIKQFIVNLQNRINPSYIIISGAPDFEFLPLEYAIRKINVLTQVKKDLQQAEKNGKYRINKQIVITK